MAGEIINFPLKYREDGEEKEIIIKIDFVSHAIRREYNDILTMTHDVQARWDRLSDITTLIESYLKEKPEDYFNKIQELKKESESLMGMIDYQDIINRRFELIKKLLLKNKITDEKLLSIEFWEECVDPLDILEFLTQAAFKDTGSKKKVMM
jgi:hypothetical protein